MNLLHVWIHTDNDFQSIMFLLCVRNFIAKSVMAINSEAYKQWSKKVRDTSEYNIINFKDYCK